MPILSCPHCSRGVQISNDYGAATVECAGCGKPFPISGTADSPAVPSDTQSSAQVSARRPHAGSGRSGEHSEAIRPAGSFPPRGKPINQASSASFINESGSVQDWKKVHLGVTLIWTGLWLGISTIAVGCCGWLGLGIQHAMGDSPTGLGIALFFFVIGGFVLRLMLQIVGLTFCLLAPRGRGAKRLATICLGLSLVSVGLALVAGIVSSAQEGRIINPIFAGWSVTLGTIDAWGAVGRALDFINLVVFFLFLRAVALNIRDENLLATVRQVLIVGAIVMALVIAITVIVAVYGDGESETPQSINSLSAGLICTASILAPGWFIWYLVALGRSRTALARYIEHRTDDLSFR
jgi:hypothetical protein